MIFDNTNILQQHCIVLCPRHRTLTHEIWYKRTTFSTFAFNKKHRRKCNSLLHSPSLPPLHPLERQSASPHPPAAKLYRIVPGLIWLLVGTTWTLILLGQISMNSLGIHQRC